MTEVVFHQTVIFKHTHLCLSVLKHLFYFEFKLVHFSLYSSYTLKFIASFYLIVMGEREREITFIYHTVLSSFSVVSRMYVSRTDHLVFKKPFRWPIPGEDYFSLPQMLLIPYSLHLRVGLQ